MDNENNLETNTYNELIGQKLIEIQMKKDEEWNEYQQKLDELQKEYNDKIDELEESEMQIGMFRNLYSDNLTIERIENLLDNLDSMNFSEEELVVIMSHLADLSTHDLIYENGLESNDVVEEKLEEINQKEPQKSDKEIADEIINNYENILAEVKKIMQSKSSMNFETNYDKAITIALDENIEKTLEQKSIINDYIMQAGKYKKKIDAIADDFAYLNKAIDGVHTKSIARDKDEIYSRISRIKETIEEYQALLPYYNYACDRFTHIFENKILQREENEEILSKLEQSKSVIDDNASEENIQDKEEENDKKIDNLQEDETQEQAISDKEEKIQTIAEEKDQISEELKYAADFIKKLEAIENLPTELLNLLNYSVKVAYENCENEGCNKETLFHSDKEIYFLKRVQA